MSEQTNYIITDLDDTLWPWYKNWYDSFSQLLCDINTVTGIDKNTLMDSFRRLHTSYKSTETSFLFMELDCLTPGNKMALANATIDGKSIMHRYNSERKNSLCLFPDVKETLSYLRKSGVKIIGFTECADFFVQYRLKNLDLDGLLDKVYTPRAFQLPDNFSLYFTNDYWVPKDTKLEYLPDEFLKPNVSVLNEIIKENNIDKRNCIYVGDSISKDMLTAQKAGITSAWAKYGCIATGEQIAMLNRVTHWSDEMIEEQKQQRVSLKPDYNLNSFGDMIDVIQRENNIKNTIKTKDMEQKTMPDLSLNVDTPISVTNLVSAIKNMGYEVNIDELKNELDIEDNRILDYDFYLGITDKGVSVADEYDMRDSATEQEKENTVSLSKILLEENSKEFKDILFRDQSFLYRMLSRLKSDCNYYLGAGGRATKHLWANDELKQVCLMTNIYNRLSEKPEWLAASELKMYQRDLWPKEDMIGTITYKTSGEVQEFNNTDKFIKQIKENLYSNPQGFSVKTLTQDAWLKKSVDDLFYDNAGMENPNSISYYEKDEKKADKEEKTISNKLPQENNISHATRFKR